MIKIANINLQLDEHEDNLQTKISKLYKVEKVKITDFKIIKKSLDARKKPIKYVYTVCFNCPKNIEQTLVKKFKEVTSYELNPYKFTETNLPKDSKIAIIGYGPAGMFSALNFINHGYTNVHVYERGKDIVNRNKSINKLFTKAILDVNSNIQFGEGGAGTYSDGKLTSRSKDPRSNYILENLVKYGGHKEITYEQHPHLGSDKLQTITKNFSSDLIARGLHLHFDSHVNDFTISNEKITHIHVNDQLIEVDYLILAIGHSSRDTIENLIKDHNVASEQKNFAVGFRIEHPQQMINSCMYDKDKDKLDQASYRVTAKTSTDKSVYSFCMCPGGLVVNSSSEENMLCTNGMSNFKRNLPNANSAILFNVNSDDYGQNILDGMYFQREIEKKAFVLGGSNYQTPAQNAIDFINNTRSTELVLKPSFPNGYKLENLRSIFNEKQNQAIIDGLNHFEKIIPGFIDKGVFTAVEARSSSPVRFTRTTEGNSLNVLNLFPTGEGAGFAGGIISSAIDGIRQSENIMKIK